MRNKKVTYILMIIVFLLLLSQTGVFGETTNKKIKGKNVEFNIKVKNEYLFPFSVSFFTAFCPEMFIYQPVSNYYSEFAFAWDFGLNFEYRFYKWFALESGLFLNPGYHYQETHYKDMVTNDYHVLKLHNSDLFLQYRLSAKFYIPHVIDATKKFKLQFCIRAGFIFESWLMSFYYLYDDGELIASGNLFDTAPDGPNAWGADHPYHLIYNYVNIGGHLAFIPKFYNNSNSISIAPEIGFAFFMVPITDGSKNNRDIRGTDALLIRNDGDVDSPIRDFKMQFEIGVSIGYSLGKEGNNLYDLLVKNKVIDPSKKKKKTTKKK